MEAILTLGLVLATPDSTRQSPFFFAAMVLTFIGSMGKIGENGYVGNRDKNGIREFLLLTLDVKRDKLGNLDKCSIVESFGRK